MRRPPQDAEKKPLIPPHIRLNFKAQHVSQMRKYQLITPLYGGGVNPAEADSVTVIRGSGVRGQLRFWWRACHGGRYSSLQAMKKAEDKLWGAASTKDDPCPSQVQITTEVDSHDCGQPFVHRKPNGEIIPISDFSSPYSYAAFPLRDKAGAVVLDGIKFKLEITYPEDKMDDIQATLWAWETFGGIGARTRRGFGALRLLSLDNVEEHSLAANEIRQDIEEKLKQYVVEGIWPRGVPHLSRYLSFKIIILNKDPHATWRYLIAKLKEFRQQRNPGSKPNRPGRSKWPEPEAIRRLSGQRMTNKLVDGMRKTHSPLPPILDEFPRASFGLPIIFHFKDSNTRNHDDLISDPRKTSLQLARFDRLASPLILRPLACAGDQAAGLALILENGCQLDELGVKLKAIEGTEQDWRVRTELDAAKAAMIVKPDGTKLLGDATNVLKAFLNFLIQS